MATLTIRTRGGRSNVDEAAVARIKQSPGVRRDLARRAVPVAAYVRLNVPMRTGKLRSSVRIDESGLGGADPAVRVGVGRGVPYGSHWVYGTRPHVILPRRKQALRFTSGGQVVFSRRVFHPGTEATGLRVLRRSTEFWRR